MKVLIISHVKPYHIDDFLAVSLLLYKYSNAVHRVIRSEQEIQRIIEEEKPDLTIVVDVGRKYEVSKNIRWYDHHQDINIPCSLVLVLRHEFSEIYEKIKRIEKLRKILEYIDIRDRYGPQKANEILGIVDQYGILQYLPALLMTEPSAEVGKNFIGLVESFSKVMDTTTVVTINNIRVAINTANPREVPPSVVFDVTEADLLIQQNVRDPNAISVVKNSKSSHYNRMDLSKLRQKYPVTFIHPNGFLAVVKIPISAVDTNLAKDIVQTILS